MPITRLVALENTHNEAGGVPLPVDYVRQVGELAHDSGLILHIDGARIFNAAAAYGVPARDLVDPADSITFCLSKGLCAPVGSVLVGSRDFIRRARRARKVLGGSMRQAGILAAAGLIALHEMTGRLQEDHNRAALLAEGLSEIPSLVINSQNTNFVYFSLTDDAGISLDEFVNKLRDDHKILMSPYRNAENRIRLRTHYWIDDQAIETILSAVKSILS